MIEVSGDARGRGVADVLAEAVGVQVQSLGGLGRYAQVSIRGSSADQVAVYLDGVPITSPAGGAVNLADIPLGQLERIEVYRGLPPTWLPGAPAGGAINLVTRAPAGRRRVEAEVGAGSFGARKARLLGQRAGERLTLTTFAEVQAASGDFEYRSAHGTPLDVFDDESLIRRSNGFEEVALHAKADVRLTGWTVGVGLGGVLADREVPKLGVLNRTTDATLRSRRGHLAVELRDDDRQSVGLDVGLHVERFTDLKGNIGARVPKEGEGRTWRVGARGHRRFQPHPHLAINALVAPRFERYSEVEWIGGGAPEPSSRVAIDATVAGEHRPGGGPMRVSPQLRATALRDDFDGRDAEDRLLLSESLTLAAGPLRASAWSGVRAPTFFELFGNRGIIVGNRDLVPERVLAAELALQADIEAADRGWRVFGEAVGFVKRAQDLIQYRQASLQASKAFNVGAADIHGVELRTRLRLGRCFEVAANYTWQRAVDAGDVPHTRGQRLPRRPDHELFVRPRVRLLGDALVIAPRLAFNSAMVLDPANLHRVRHRRLLGVDVDVRVPWDLVVKLTADNLLDERTEDFQGYPLPGRSFHAALGWRWIGGGAP